MCTSMFHQLHRPSTNILFLSLPFATGSDFVLKRAVASPDTKILLLGFSDQPLDYSMASDGLHIKFPIVPYGKLLHAWTFKMTNLK